jgi:hypothetical protein
VGIHRNRGSQFLTAVALSFWATGITAADPAVATATATTAVPAACPHAAATAPAPKALAGVTAISPRDAWAVGWTSGALPRPVLAHWNGSSWTTVSSPALQTPAVLLAVAKFRGGLWAVGARGQTVGGQHRTHLILRVTGTTVRAVPTPRPLGGKLLGVAATSAKNAWAVGYNAGGGPLILHWNGTAWTRSALPAHASGRINAVTATSATNAWAIDNRNHGNAQIWRWNGRRWSRVAAPVIKGQTYSLGGVTATSARNAWAVGTSFVSATVTIRTVILHWNGARWRRMRSPNPPSPDGDGLVAVSASSADNAWAVGTNTAGPSLTANWNGTSWRAVSAPGCADLAGVSILSPDRGWAVGSFGNRMPVILEWKGTSWQSMPLT